MQPAFSGTRFPPPSSSAAVFTGLDRSSTGRAADTWIPAVMQRVVRNAVRLDVSPNIIARPLHEGIDFDQGVRLITSFKLKRLHARRLLPPQPSNPSLLPS